MKENDSVVTSSTDESYAEKVGAGLSIPACTVVRLINNFHENVVMDTSGDKFTVVAIYDDTYHDQRDIRLVAEDDETRVFVPADVFATGYWSIEKVGDGTLRLRCEKPSRAGVFWEGVLYSSCARIVDVLES